MRARYRVDLRKRPPADPEANPSSARPADEVRREQLLDLPPTEYIAEKITWTRDHLALLSGDPANVTYQRLRNDLAVLEPQLADCLERDDLAAHRPEACWCLGLGGRGQRWIPVRNEEDGEIAYLRTFREYCDCPDGQEAKAIAERMQSDRA